MAQWVKAWDPCVFGRPCGAATAAALTEARPAWGAGRQVRAAGGAALSLYISYFRLVTYDG